MLVCSRELLTVNRTYYVRTDGNDSNNGLTNTAGGAFLTIQKAVNVVLDTLDLGGFDVSVQIGDGTYTAEANITGPQTGRGTITLQGNASTPGNVIVSVTSANAISVDGPVDLSVRDMELRTTTSGVCLSVLVGDCSVSNVRFGAAATGHMQASFGAILKLQNYAIVGSTPSHLLVTHGGSVYASAVTITLSGTPNWSQAFLYMATCGSFRAEAMTFSGAATGRRYYIEANAVVQTIGGGANYFPGNIAGSTLTGGQYA